jgi:NAD(P)H-quinone oxidoreductase subunit 5
MFLSVGIFLEQVNGNSAHSQLWSWIQVGGLSLQVGYFIDPLSAIMLILVTSVAICVMIYSHGYMQHDKGYVRFFTYLSLFTASMLGLVLSPNLVQVYVFWELVGMCSYLLVGFWFARPNAAYACQKAFITNRVGDFGLLLGILGFYWLTGSLEFQVIAERTHQVLSEYNAPKELLILSCIGLFLGPVAKSAQFPLHVWLPDAMEGPTPISALIHAATMVAAGVFLIARLLPIFEQIPFMMDIIAWTGGITALLGATIALAQKDLKKGLAYSTMSQLGYMVLALGVGAYQTGLFHLITHAYSKALLFLGSGSVIHGIEPIVGYHPNKCQNMRYMGGLRAYMPTTATTFLIGTLSLCGIPPFACFWSKDEILAETWSKLPVLGFIGWLTAGLTAFYMFRIYFLTFEGQFRGNLVESQTLHSVLETNNPIEHIIGYKTDTIYPPSSVRTKFPKESGLSMVLPLVILTVPTIFIGLLGAPFPKGIPNSSLLSHWLYVDADTAHNWEVSSSGWQQFAIDAIPSIGIAIAGASLAWIVYGPHVARLQQNTPYLDPPGKGWIKTLLNIIYNWSLRRAYIDEFYDQTFVLITRQFAQVLSFLDQWAIDGIINAGGLITLLLGEGGKYTEGGRIPSYILVLTITFLIFLITGILIHPII